MRRSCRGKREKGRGAAQAAGDLPTTARLLGPSAPKCPKAEIPMGRVPPVPDNRRFPRETPAAISSRRQSRLFGFDSIPRNHAEKWKSTGLPPADSLAPLPRGRPETEPKLHASVAIRQGTGNCPGPYRVLCRHAIERQHVSMHRHDIARRRVSMHRHAMAYRHVAVHKRFVAHRHLVARRLQATRPWCPSGRPQTPCPSTKHQSYPA